MCASCIAWASTIVRFYEASTDRETNGSYEWSNWLIHLPSSKHSVDLTLGPDAKTTAKDVRSSDAPSAWGLGGGEIPLKFREIENMLLLTWPWLKLRVLKNSPWGWGTINQLHPQKIERTIIVIWQQLSSVRTSSACLGSSTAPSEVHVVQEAAPLPSAAGENKAETHNQLVYKQSAAQALGLFDISYFNLKHAVLKLKHVSRLLSNEIRKRVKWVSTSHSLPTSSNLLFIITFSSLLLLPFVLLIRTGWAVLWAMLQIDLLMWRLYKLKVPKAGPSDDTVQNNYECNWLWYDPLVDFLVWSGTRSMHHAPGVELRYSRGLHFSHRLL